MEQIYKTEMTVTLDSLIDSGRLKDKTLFAFGCCRATEEMLEYLAIRGITVSAILDNNTVKIGTIYQNSVVLEPIEIRHYDDSKCLVLIANKHYSQMTAQLRGLGYQDEIIKVVDYNTFAEYSLTEDTLMRKIERVERGIETLHNIRKQYPEHHLVVCPNNALGDVYWAMSFLPAYLEKHGIPEAAVIVAGNGCRQTADLFGVQNLTVLDRGVMDEFVQALMFTREDNCIIAHHDLPYTDNIICYLNKRFLSFIDYYRYAVYGLTEDVIPVNPSKSIFFENKPGFIKSKSVIIAPYAKSVVGIPKSFWRTIIDDCNDSGIAVFTNVTQDEQPLEGTEPLTLPLNQMNSAVEYAGTFIGVRSGLCDIIHTAKCKKTVVFPDAFYSTTPFKTAEFFALPGWEQIVYE